ncbi:RNA ligase family protein [Streptomyces sp. TG1A-8]|uniref:RNA ligase family protein n=1 Tax=Streptomyces sp. TG1A-8 TaxID=3051385 RepID=UPI00265C1474|nr:RNA ligase family protein [Streptomyces sp. TG1A-8]MDO0926799.1 RNA ligase family protein [Streptomyces sp. TG1A-8]
MTNHTFTAWPKIPRLLRTIVVTEKLDGTNAAIHISTVPHIPAWPDFPPGSYSVVVDGTRYVLTAQSRSRVLTPGEDNDNFGFAGWVYENAEGLVRALGTGVHFGEWWGFGTRRGYGLPDRRFSLFDTDRHKDVNVRLGSAIVEPARCSIRACSAKRRLRTHLLRLLRAAPSLPPASTSPKVAVCGTHSRGRCSR